MPSGRSKEDTWKSEELEKNIKESRDERRHRKDRDRDREKPRDKNREHKRTENDEERRERRHRDKENGHHGDKPRTKRDEDFDPYLDGHQKERRHKRQDGDSDRRRERKHRTKEEEDYYQLWGEEFPQNEKKDRERRHRDDKDRHRDDKERKHRDDKDRRHRDDKERKHRDDKDKHRDDRERRHRDDKDDRRHRDKDERRRHDDGERRSKRSEEEGSRHKDRDRERRKERERDGDDRRDRRRERDEGEAEEDREARRQRERRERREQRKREEEEEAQRKAKEKSKSAEKADSGNSAAAVKAENKNSESESCLEGAIAGAEGNPPTGDVVASESPDMYSYESDFEPPSSVSSVDPKSSGETLSEGGHVSVCHPLTATVSEGDLPAADTTTHDTGASDTATLDKSATSSGLVSRKPSLMCLSSTTAAVKPADRTVSMTTFPRKQSKSQLVKTKKSSEGRQTLCDGNSSSGSSLVKQKRSVTSLVTGQPAGKTTWATWGQNEAPASVSPQRRKKDQPEPSTSSSTSMDKKSPKKSRSKEKSKAKTSNVQDASRDDPKPKSKPKPKIGNPRPGSPPAPSVVWEAIEVETERPATPWKVGLVTSGSPMARKVFPTTVMGSPKGPTVLRKAGPPPPCKTGLAMARKVVPTSSLVKISPPTAAEEEPDYNYDDEEFEDYDDDFEDDDDEKDDDESEDDRSSQSGSLRQSDKRSGDEMDEILRAMNSENERLIADSRRNQLINKESSPSPSDRPSSSKRTFINFVSARARQTNQKAATKAARRGLELLQIIELDHSAHDMFDMPPVTEYNMYMRSFGSSNTKQAYIQTNDDNIDRDVQTEEVESLEKWSQHPPADIVASGGQGGGDSDPDSASASISSAPVDAARLSSFLSRAGPVVCVLLEEEGLSEPGGGVSATSGQRHANVMVGDTYTQLQCPEFLKGRPAIQSQFSPVQSHMLLTAHQTPEKPSSDLLTRQGCVCVWNVNDPAQPQKILMCESRPTCCCFSPTKTSLVFAGMHDGSVVVWDLREVGSLHRKQNLSNGRSSGEGSLLLRYPSYNTAGVLSYDNHQSPVVAVSPIVTAGERASVQRDNESASLSGLAQAESGEGLSFQLATLEVNGTINLWVVAELSSPDLAGSESDFGLSPGSKVKLVKSSSILLDNPLRDNRLRTTMKCADLQLLPTNNSHYYVATDTGCVVHGVRYGGKAPPKAYRSAIDNPVEVTSVDFSPFSEPVFLVGCADGSLRLYHVDSERPLLFWPSTTSGAAVHQVAWSRSRPAVFFVLDEVSRLYLWDLLMDDSSPVKTESVSESRVLSMCLSNDHSATGLGLPGRRPQMVMCLESGVCEVHTMTQQFSALTPDELDQFAQFLQRVG